MCNLPSSDISHPVIYAQEGKDDSSTWAPPKSCYRQEFCPTVVGGVVQGPWVFHFNQSALIDGKCFSFVSFHLCHFIDSTVQGGNPCMTYLLFHCSMICYLIDQHGFRTSVVSIKMGFCPVLGHCQRYYAPQFLTPPSGSFDQRPLRSLHFSMACLKFCLAVSLGGEITPGACLSYKLYPESWQSICLSSLCPDIDGSRA